MSTHRVKMPSGWQSFDCPRSTKKWRYLDDGRIEVTGEGVPTKPWYPVLNKWKPLIEAASKKHGVPASWIAAVMALETGHAQSRGQRLCLVRQGVCDPGEGAGLMAVLNTTASMMAGRKVTIPELMTNHELAIDVGTKYLKKQLDRYNGDFVKAAVGYNAGSVRCGRGGTFMPFDKKGVWSREGCPDLGWGVVVGCGFTSGSWARRDPRCAPTTTPGNPAYKCTNDYPGTVIKLLNAAITEGPYRGAGVSAAGLGTMFAALLIGGALGFGAVSYFRP